MKKRYLYIILAIGAIFLIGLVFIVTRPAQNQQESQIATNNQQITYSGKDGVTAMALLEQNAKVEFSGTGEMSFVNSVNGVTADATKNQYWAFSVNGEDANVGAGSYITKDTDTITWKLSSF